MLQAPVFSAACLAFVGLLLVAESRQWPRTRVFAKLAASSCFVLVAWQLGALGSPYGRWILAALLLSWMGDALLLSERAAAFMAGLAAFLAAHLCFAAAFFLAGVGAPGVLAATAFVALLLGAAVLAWLWPHTPANFRWPVLAYVVAILAMCVAAAAHAWGAERGWVLAGAWLFAASDIAVARQRFVRQSPVNQLWGLPAYFIAQLLLAWSVADAA